MSSEKHPLELIEFFYNSFQNLRAEDMCSCYHWELQFSDPAFGSLDYHRTCAMWRMLCESQQGKNFKLTYSEPEWNEGKGSVRWEAEYIFSSTGRKVHNRINAEFIFRDGLIVRHQDTFSLYKWSVQALGFRGMLMGWTGFFSREMQKRSNSLLNRYMKSQEERQTNG